MTRRLSLLLLLSLASLSHAGWFSHGAAAKSITPSGPQATLPSTLQIVFDKTVKGVGNVVAGFNFTPATEGYAYVNGHVVTFNPSNGFKPATDYHFSFKTERVRSEDGMDAKEISGSFSTPDLKLLEKRPFFNVDEASGTEKELVIELAFNYPVKPEALHKVLTLKSGSKELSYRAESGGSAERVYLKLGRLLDDNASIDLTQTGPLLCEDCGKANTSLLNGRVASPGRLALELKEFKLDANPAGSRVTLQFTLPVSKATLQHSVSIEPALPFSVDTEYLFGIIKADFKPGVKYKLSLPQGMKSKSGRGLANEVVNPIRLNDFPVQVGFVDQGNLLPAAGSAQVLVKSVNAKKIHVEVRKIYRNNLLRYLQTGDRDNSGALAWEGDLDVPAFDKNHEQETALSLAKWQRQGFRGMLLLHLSANNLSGEESSENEGEGEYDEDGGWRGYGSLRNYQGKRQRWVLVTDLGLVAKVSGKDLWVQVMRLNDLQPVAGAKIEVISQTNQVMQSRSSDAQGRILFKDFLEGPEQSHAAMLLASQGDDFAFLDLNQGALGQERFDVGGDPFVADGLDAFISSDRGLYRPGDTANFTAIVRHLDLSVADKLPPLRLRIRNSEGNEVAKLKGSADNNGLAIFSFSATSGLPTGAYRADLGFEDGQVLRSANFKIEEFIPQKIKVELQGPKQGLQKDQELEASVKARMLFGAEAPGLKVSGQVEWEPRNFVSAEFPGYSFYDVTRNFQGQSEALPEGSTNAQGLFNFKLNFPAQYQPPSMLEARLYAEVMDEGGRPVSAYTTVEAHPYDHYLGLKVEGGGEGTDKPLTVKVAAASPDGKALDLKNVPVVVRRKSWYSIFRRYHWRGQRWESTFYEETVLMKTLDLAQGKGDFVFTPTGYGEYTIIVGAEEGHRASHRFYAGQAQDSGDLEGADKLGLEFDQAKVKAGENARLRIKAPFAGRLLLTIEREKVFETRILDVPQGNSVQSFKMEDAWLPNVYAVGVLTRKPDEAHRELPMVSFGVVPLIGDTRSRALDIQWETPGQVASKAQFQAKLKIPGGAGAKVVLAAVDEGILQIVGFESPDPHKHFYRKRGLTTQTWSTFRDLLPEVFRKEAIGGDEEAALKKKHLNPVDAQRVKSMARYSGVLTADAEGRVTWDLPLKGFQGEIRLMAIAVEGKRFGGSDKHVQIADEVVLESYLPRFLAPEDSIDLPVTLYNRGKKAKSFKVKLDLDGPVSVQGEASQALEVPAGGQGRLRFQVKARASIGKARFNVAAYEGVSKSASQETELAVRPAAPMITLFKGGRLKPGESVEMAVPAGWLKTGQKSRLLAGSDDLTRFAKKLEQLLAYPHGCAEQLTSQVFPLLYFKDVSLLPGADDEKKAKATRNIQFVVDRLQAMQAPDGGIDYWENPSQSNPYLTRFVGHFLLEAERLGYKPNEGMMERLRHRLAEMPSDSYIWADYYETNDLAGVADPYLLWVKALAGSPDKQAMHALRDQRLGTMGADDRCMLSLAYSAIGDAASAKKVLPLKSAVWNTGRRYFYGGSLGTPTKTVALYLNALAAINPLDGGIGDVIDDLAKRAMADDYFHTQETAWMLMGVARAAQGNGMEVSGEWGIVGESQRAFQQKSFHAEPEQPSGKTLRLKNTGTAALNYSLSAEGYAAQPRPESIFKGIKLKRVYRNKSGGTVDLAKVVQGDIVVVTLQADLSEAMENLVFVDLLPAGFEVDNPRLNSRGELGFDPETSFTPANADYRDDRVLLFTKGVPQGKLNFSYTVRAVSPGQYRVPGVLVEAMYKPDVFARVDEGLTLTVVPKP
jgi:uncharacterized protein YfaS (alpha-2-macroglobulin family)